MTRRLHGDTTSAVITRGDGPELVLVLSTRYTPGDLFAQLSALTSVAHVRFEGYGDDDAIILIITPSVGWPQLEEEIRRWSATILS